MSLSETEQDDPARGEPEPSRAAGRIQHLREHWMSYGLIAVFVLVYFYELWYSNRLGTRSMRIDSRVLLYLGANFPSAFMAGEYWRAFTSCFLHLDGMHLFMNSMALYYFGPLIERSFGPWRLLLAFVLTGVFGSLATILLHLNTPYLSAGASGGLYGLFGVIFVAGKRYRAGLPKEFQTWLNQTLGALVIFSFIPYIDMWAHFGGLASGLILGLLYRPRQAHEAESLLGEPLEQKHPEREQENSTSPDDQA
ncbi:MAG: rhomboid family intramembrane serine protease [Candidatus Sericytochromatia bacterium]